MLWYPTMWYIISYHPSCVQSMLMILSTTCGSLAMAYTLGFCLSAVYYMPTIVLMSSSCYGLQKLFNICTEYRNKWDI